MAAKTFRLAAGQDGNFGALSESDQAAASRTDGWTVAKLAAANMAEFDAGTKQASGSFSTATKPASFLTGSTANALKTPSPLTGVFSNAAWTLTFAVRAGTASSQAGRMRVRVFRSANADGSSATEITGATQIGTTSAALSTTADQTTVVTWNPGATITLTNEYLFFVLAWEITTASGSNSGDVLMRTGQSAGGTRIATPSFAETMTLAAAVVGNDAVGVDIAPTRGLDAAVVGTDAVDVDLTVTKPTSIIELGIDIAGNEALSGEWLSGQFLSGRDPILFVDLTVVRIKTVDIAVAGQGAVSVGLSITRPMAVTVAGAATVVAQQNQTKGLAVPVGGVSTVAVAEAVTRGFASAVAAAGAISAELGRIRSFALALAGVGQVTVDLQPVPPAGGPVFFDASISGKADVFATTAGLVPMGISVSGQGQVSTPLNPIRQMGVGLTGIGVVTASESVVRGLGTVAIAGSGQVSVDAVRTRAVAFSITGSGQVSAAMQISRIVAFDIQIATIIPLCGEHLVGTFICGGTVGPRTFITVGVSRSLVWEIPISGQGEVFAELRPSTPFAVLVEGQSNVQANFVRSLVLATEISGKGNVDVWLSRRLALAALIQGQAQVFAKMRIAWLNDTIPGDILLPPTQERDWILIPTTNGSTTLTPAEEENVLLDPTEEEDWLLVPTTERG